MVQFATCSKGGNRTTDTKKEQKQRLMADEILKTMEERRKVKGNTVRYEQMGRKVKEKGKKKGVVKGKM